VDGAADTTLDRPAQAAEVAVEDGATPQARVAPPPGATAEPGTCAGERCASGATPTPAAAGPVLPAVAVLPEATPTPTPSLCDACPSLTRVVQPATSTPGPTATPAGPTPTPDYFAMSIDCDVSDADIDTVCSYPAGSVFDVAVVIDRVREEYYGVQAVFRWPAAGLEYLPAASLEDERVLSDCEMAFGQRYMLSAQEGLMVGCMPDAAAGSPFVATGRAFVLQFRCQDSGTTEFIWEHTPDSLPAAGFFDEALEPQKSYLVNTAIICG
jgi:hypothetical protein